MGWYVDLPTQVRRILPRRSGGTGNQWGWATDMVVAAAVIMGTVFFAFVLSADRISKEFGLVLAVAILGYLVVALVFPERF